MTYAAYLRIYEPVAAFHEPERSRRAAYAASAARPRRRDSLAVEHAEALQRAITAPQIVVPDQESEHAYIRRVDGVTHVCPWQTRLRCLLGPARSTRPVRKRRPRPGRCCTPHRCPGPGGAWPAAWRRCAACRPGFAGAVWDPVRAETEVGEVGRWLEEFHPYSLVELDYGGLVQLLSDDALSSDQSAAEIAAAIDGVTNGERELALAMYKRAQGRWRAFAEYEMAN